jgi:DNA-binding NarL/FixJ family response regulator
MINKENLSIIIADDHPIFRSGLKNIISAEDNINIIGEAADGIKALELILEKSPDIAILDMSMPGMTGLNVLKSLKEKGSTARVVFLTMFMEEDIFDEAMELGINGYVLKESAENDILECINQVATNNYYISPLISNLLIKRHHKLEELSRQTPLLENLTPTERKILKLISRNKTSKEISEELFVSYRTIENHRTNINNKLNLKGSHSLIKFAIENKTLL